MRQDVRLVDENGYFCPVSERASDTLFVCKCGKETYRAYIFKGKSVCFDCKMKRKRLSAMASKHSKNRSKYGTI